MPIVTFEATYGLYLLNYRQLVTDPNTYVGIHNEAAAIIANGGGLPAIGQQHGVPPPWENWYIYRGGVFFDTSSIPIGATIISAILSLYGLTDSSVVDFDLTVVDGSDLQDPVVIADYGELLDDIISGGSINTLGWSLAGYNNIILNPTGLGWIVPGGTTKFGLRSSRDINSNVPAGDEWIEAYGVDVVFPARLVIEYYIVPTVTTDPATGVVDNSASLNGTLIDDGGEACQCGFEWGLTPAYGNTTPTQSRITGQTFLQSIGPLSPSTTYYFRAFATNSVGTSYGAGRSFTTLAPSYYSSLVSPQVQTNPATSVRLNSAQLNGEVIEDAGRIGDTRFQWGLTTEYGNNTPWQEGYGKGDDFLVGLANLSEGQSFHFRTQFRTQGKVVDGSDMSFNTLATLGPVVLVDDELVLLLEDR